MKFSEIVHKLIILKFVMLTSYPILTIACGNMESVCSIPAYKHGGRSVIKRYVSRSTSRVFKILINFGIPFCLPRKKRYNGLNSRRPTSFSVYMFTVIESTKEELEYITWPWHAASRNAYLVANVRPLVVWDVFAGVGCDTIQFAGLFPMARVHSVQFQTLDGREKRLARNTSSLGNCAVHECSSSFFLLSRKGNCDFLYLDPPWKHDGRFLRPQDLREFLKMHVFDAIVTNIGLVCVKTMFKWSVLALDYTLIQTIESSNKRKYFFHFFKLK
jgi:hypothetical protein